MAVLDVVESNLDKLKALKPAHPHFFDFMSDIDLESSMPTTCKRMKFQVLQPPSERKSNEIRAKYNWPKIGEPGSQ
eukprot:107600-Pyramimonas_sp.AAC.1